MKHITEITDLTAKDVNPIQLIHDILPILKSFYLGHFEIEEKMVIAEFNTLIDDEKLMKVSVMLVPKYGITVDLGNYKSGHSFVKHRDIKLFQSKITHLINRNIRDAKRN